MRTHNTIAGDHQLNTHPRDLVSIHSVSTRNWSLYCNHTQSLDHQYYLKVLTQSEAFKIIEIFFSHIISGMKKTKTSVFFSDFWIRRKGLNQMCNSLPPRFLLLPGQKLILLSACLGLVIFRSFLTTAVKFKQKHA